MSAAQIHNRGRNSFDRSTRKSEPHPQTIGDHDSCRGHGDRRQSGERNSTSEKHHGA